METIRSTHPMFVVAAASVTALSLTGIAVLGGWLPTKHEAAQATAPAAQVSAAPAPGSRSRTDTVRPVAAPRAVPPSRTPEEPAARARPAVFDTAHETARVTQPVSDSGIYAERSRQNEICAACGTIESVREVAQPGEGSWMGSVAGGVVGGLLGNQIGRGNGRTLATVAGAVGGAFAGREVEKHVRSDKHYEITVRFDDGRVQSFSDTQPPVWRNGDRVRLSNGQLNGI